jgi:predicted MFS family arabinose efflux permease
VLRLAESREGGGDPAYGWAIVAALGVTETVSYGVLNYAFAVLLVPMQHDTGWSRTALTGAYSLALLVSGLVALRAGTLLDEHSPRLLMTAGSILAALLVLAWSRARNLLELYTIFAGLGVAMALVLYEPAFIVVTKWFRERRHAALTAVTLVAALASFVFSPLTQRLAHDLGWRSAVAVLALILAAVTTPLHALVLRAPPDGEPPAAANLPTPRDVVRRGAFWLIVAALALGSFVSVAISVHLVSLLVGGGRSAGFAAFAAGLMGVSQIPGRLLFALSGHRLGVAGNAAFAFVLGAAALVLLATTRQEAAVLVFVVCFGISNGLVTLLRPTLIGDLYGGERFGAISGVVSVFVLGARAAAPFGASIIALAPGGYTVLLVVLAALIAGAAGCVARGVAVERELC